MYCRLMRYHDYVPPTDLSPEQNISDVPSLELGVPCTTVYDVSLTDGSRPWTDRNVN